jgi:hypothetical protein
MGYARATTVLRDTLMILERIAPNDFARYWCHGLLGAAMAGEKKFAETEPLLVEGCDGMVKHQDAVPVVTEGRLMTSQSGP